VVFIIENVQQSKKAKQDKKAMKAKKCQAGRFGLFRQ
jgi:hypothetical protein